MGANDGGVKRGDRADTGDLEAKPKDTVGRGGSGVRAGEKGPVGAPTADPGGLGSGSESRQDSDDAPPHQ
jgi:hypothetical protein